MECTGGFRALRSHVQAAKASSSRPGSGASYRRERRDERRDGEDEDGGDSDQVSAHLLYEGWREFGLPNATVRLRAGISRIDGKLRVIPRSQVRVLAQVDPLPPQQQWLAHAWSSLHDKQRSDATKSACGRTSAT